jgi:hypothetical protein
MKASGVLRLALFLGCAMTLLASVAGCAGPMASHSRASSSVPAAFAPSLVSGTWRGSFSQTAASLYEDEGDCMLQIKEDGTFTATVTRAKRGTNNLAKTSTWSGTVVTRGNRVTLRGSQGPSVTFMRSGNSLYGVAEDPFAEATIAMSLQRENGATS